MATTATTSNSGGMSGTAFDSMPINSGGALTFSSAAAMHGALGYAVTGSTAGGVYVSWSHYNDTQMAVRFYYNPGSALPGAIVRLLDVRNSSATATRILVSATNNLILQDATSTTIFTSPTVLSTNTWYRIELGMSVSATAATIKYDYYLGDATTPAETGYATTTGNTGSSNITTVNVGSASTSTWTGTAYFDDISVTNGSSTYLGPFTPTVPGAPTAVSAVPGNTNAIVSFTAPASNGGSAIIGYTATATPGSLTGSITGASAAPITVSGLTNGTAYTFTVHATNSIGNGSESAASSSVTPVAGGTLIQNTADGGTNGTTATAGNTGGASGTAFNSVVIGSGAALVFSSATAAHGTLSYALSGASGTTTYLVWSGYNDTQMAARFYYNPGSTLPSNTIRLLDIRNSSATAARVVLNATNNLSVQNTAGTTVFTSATSLSTNTWYRIEMAISVSATTAIIKYDYYLGDSTSPVESGYNTTTGNTGSSNITLVEFGSVGSATWAGTSYFDDLAAQNATTTYIGVPGTAAPTANAGTNQSVNPYATVTLSGSATTASGHSATYQWAALSGAPAITSGATSLTATIATISGTIVAPQTTPVDVTYSYQLTVTQDDAQTASSTVTVTVVYANRYRAHSGSWTPQQLTKRAHSSTWI